MKKKLSFGAFIIIAAISLAACGTSTNNAGGSDTTSTANETGTQEMTSTENDIGGENTPSDYAGTAADIANDILNKCEFKDTLSPVDKTMALTRLYELDEDMVLDGAFYTNTQATAEEIAVIKVAEADYAGTVKEAYQARIADQKNACENYLPDEMPKLDSAVIYTSGDYVVLCISNNNSEAEEVISDYFN